MFVQAVYPSQEVELSHIALQGLFHEEGFCFGGALVKGINVDAQDFPSFCEGFCRFLGRGISCGEPGFFQCGDGLLFGLYSFIPFIVEPLEDGVEAGTETVIGFSADEEFSPWVHIGPLIFHGAGEIGSDLRGRESWFHPYQVILTNP